MPLTPGAILQGRYHIDALLGQGGMGAVYRAADLRFNALVAVKENIDTSPQAQQQFAAEAGVLFHLHHPNLPRVTDYFLVPGQGQYLVMDYVQGEDLDHVLTRRGPLPEKEALSYIGPVLEALEYLHHKSVFHRDVKPANIKVTPEGQVVLVDFGLVKVGDPFQGTATGARAATPGYAPLEQYGAGGTDARSDVYAAGATLYALLAGQAPPDVHDLVTRRARLVPLWQANPSVSSAAEAAVQRAMQIQPDDRFQAAAEMRAALFRPVPVAAPVMVQTVTHPHSPWSPYAPTAKVARGGGTSPGRAWMWSGGLLALAALVILLLWRPWAENRRGVTPQPTAIARTGTTAASAASTTPQPADTHPSTATRTATSIPTFTPIPAGTPTATPTLTSTATSTLAPTPTSFTVPQSTATVDFGRPVNILWVDSCDPRTDPEICHESSDRKIFEEFYWAISASNASLTYQVPPSESDLDHYDVVIANFCGSARSETVSRWLGSYVASGGSVVVMGDNFCAGTAEAASSLTQQWGISFTDDDDSSARWADPALDHPLNVGINRIYAYRHAYLVVQDPARIVANMGDRPFIGLYDQTGTVVAIPDVGFHWGTSWQSETGNSDNFNLWRNMFVWLSQQSRIKRR